MHILVNLKSNWLGFLLRTAPCCSISWDVPTWGLTTGWLQMPVLRCGCLSVWEKQKDVRVRILITMQCQPQTSSVCCQVPPYQYNRSKAITLAIVCTLCQQLKTAFLDSCSKGLRHNLWVNDTFFLTEIGPPHFHGNWTFPFWSTQIEINWIKMKIKTKIEMHQNDHQNG